MQVLFKRVSEPRGQDAKLPRYAKETDAGADVFAAETVLIPAQSRALVRTGLLIEPPRCVEVQVRSKSGRALKEGLVVLNSPGTIDPGYRGEVGVILYNSSMFDVTVEVGQAIAQLVFSPVYVPTITETLDDLSSSDRGQGGFGSTGLE